MTQSRPVAPRSPAPSLKIRVPLLFEAVAEGRLAVILLAVIFSGAAAVLLIG